MSWILDLAFSLTEVSISSLVSSMSKILSSVCFLMVKLASEFSVEFLNFSFLDFFQFEFEISLLIVFPL